MTDQKIVMVICMVCEKRGPEAIYFRADYLDGVRITAVCGGCRNSEVVLEGKTAAEVQAMADAGRQLDLSHLKRFTVC